MKEKLKSFFGDDATYFALLLVLVAVVSFGLGRKSMVSLPVLSQPGQAAGVAVSTFQLPEASTSRELPDTTAVVASKAGTKYHALTCPGAGQIKEENKIFFATLQAAEAAGYSPAANCPLFK